MSTAFVPLIPESDRIPFFQKIMFSAGNCMDFIATSLMIGTFWMPFFNIGLGLDPMKIGFALMVLQIWNAVIGPVISNLSDNTRTRWGRRRPFMFVAAILTAMVIPWIWHPPVGLAEKGFIIYMIVIGALFYTCLSFWTMPYYGMQMELTPNYDERTRLTAWNTLFGKLSTLIGGWAMVLVSSQLFANPATGKPDIVHGVQVCSWLAALAILVFGLLPPLFVKERYYEAETKNQKRDPFLKSIWESAQCRPLWCLNGIAFFMILGGGAVSSLGSYLNIYYVCGGDLNAAAIIGGFKSMALVFTGILCIPLYTWLAEKFDKRTVLGWMIGITMFGHSWSYFLTTPRSPYLQLISGVFESAAAGSIWLLLPSMKGDTADYDEHATSRRREGALNAFFSWFVQAGLATATGLGGFMLVYVGFDIKNASLQPPEVLQAMLVFYAMLPLLIWGIALYFVWLYPLDRPAMIFIRDQLEQRRGRI